MADLTLDQAMQLATQLHQSGRVVDAEKLYRHILAKDPRNASALNMLGVLGGQMGQLDHGADLINRAIKIKPEIAEYHNNLGELYRRSEKLDRAAAAFTQALKINPSYPEPHYNLGLTYIAAGRTDAAIAEFRRAIVLRPNYTKAHNNLGNALKDIGRIDDAIAAYRAAIAVNPNDQSAWSNLLFALHYLPDHDGIMVLAEHKIWADSQARPLAAHIATHQNDRSPNRRLKIGYVSADFRDHPVGRMLMPLLAHHDHQSFEIICYSNGTRTDSVTQRMKTYADQWHEITALNDEQLAQRIRADGIDILVDLAAHTAGNRLMAFARKPAPVQVTWLGCPGTTGLGTIDYRLIDAYFDPPGEEEPYTEQTIRLRSQWCYEPRNTPDVNPLPALQTGHITFGCLNNFSKINPSVLQVWIKILQTIPNSRLILKADPGSHLEALKTIFQTAGIAPERIEFIGKLPDQQYWELYSRIDIGLDPFPFNGHTTTLDFLWMGVPVITLRGTTCVGRGGVSALSNIGLTDWIAGTRPGYIAIAERMTGNLKALAQLRGSLRGKMQSSPLTDAPAYARDFEAALRGMWSNWCQSAK